MRWTTALMALALLATQPVSASEEVASVALPEPLAKVLRQYEAAWQARNAAELASLFTEDGFVLSGGRPPIRGRTAIEEHYTGRGGPLSLRAFSFATEGSVGYILGGYTSRAGEPDAGKFTLTLRKAPEGHWLIHSDMDSGNSRRPEGP